MSFDAGSEITEFGTPEAVVCAHAAGSATPTAAVESENVPTPSPVDFAILLILICPPNEIECSALDSCSFVSSLALLDGELNRSSKHFSKHLVRSFPSEHPAGHRGKAMLDRPYAVLI